MENKDEHTCNNCKMFSDLFDIPYWHESSFVKFKEV